MQEQQLQSQLNARYPGLYVTKPEAVEIRRAQSDKPSVASPATVPKPSPQVEAPAKTDRERLVDNINRMKMKYMHMYAEADKDLLFAYGVLTTAFALVSYFVITVYFVKREY